MEFNSCNSTSYLKVTFSQYDKAFGLPVTPVALLVPGVKPHLYSHRFKSLRYTKTVKWITP